MACSANFSTFYFITSPNISASSNRAYTFESTPHQAIYIYYKKSPPDFANDGMEGHYAIISFQLVRSLSWAVLGIFGISHTPPPDHLL